MAADKEIMKAIETLRLDRPGRAYRASAGIGERIELAAGLAELAQTFREEAELWSKSGARGWKSSEADAYLVAQQIDDVAAQLDNTGGGAGLSVSVDVPGITDADIEAELRASALRVDAVRDLAGLDALIADSIAKRRGHVRDELLPDGHPARSDADDADFCGPKDDGGWTCAPARCDRRQECPLSDPDDVTAYLKGEANDIPGSDVERKTAHDWNDDPRIDPVVVSWSDFGSSAHYQGIDVDPTKPITRAEFERVRDGGAVTVGPRRRPQLPMAPGTRVEIKGDDVTAYLKGEINDIPGSAPLTPGSVTSAPEADDPFAKPYCRDCDLDQHRCYGCGEPVEHGKYACAQCELIHADGPAPECCQHMLAPDEDPAPWCDGRQGVDHDEHNGPCKYKAHLRADHDARAGLVLDPNGSVHGPDDRNYSREVPSTPPMLLATTTMPPTWESEIMTADGHRPPGLAPLLGQPGDAGTGYSHDYIPAGGRRFTYAELLTPVPAASLPPHLSHSQGNTIGDCATKYRLQRVEQLPQVPQWANVGGSAAHACFEAIERMMVDNPALSLDSIDVELVWKHHFEAEIARVSASSPVPVSVWRASRKGAEGRQWWEVNGPLMLRRYLDARPVEPSITIDSSGTPAIEWEITADVPTPYGPLPYKSVLDRVTYAPNTDSVMIRDYKTSYERPTDTTQLGDYAHMLLLSGANLHGATRILGTYFDARRGEWTTPVDLLDVHPFEAFQYRVTTAYAQRWALTTGPTPARPSSYCGGCSVRYACPIMAAKS